MTKKHESLQHNQSPPVLCFKHPPSRKSYLYSSCCCCTRDTWLCALIKIPYTTPKNFLWWHALIILRDSLNPPPPTHTQAGCVIKLHICSHQQVVGRAMYQAFLRDYWDVTGHIGQTRRKLFIEILFVSLIVYVPIVEEGQSTLCFLCWINNWHLSAPIFCIIHTV